MSCRIYIPFENSKKEKESNINKYRLMKGLTYDKLSKLSGTYPGEIVALNNGTVSPIREDGKIRNTAKKLAKSLNCELEDLFPRYFCGFQKKDFTQSQLNDYAISNFSVKNNFESLIINSLFLSRCIEDAELQERQKKCIKLRFIDDLTLEEVGKIFGVSRDRARQIEAAALRKIRQVANKKIKEVI